MKLFLVQQEHNVDGEISFETIPCTSLDLAKRELKKCIENITNIRKFADLDINNPSDDYEVDIYENSATFKLPYDDYYEYYYIEEKQLIEE